MDLTSADIVREQAMALDFDYDQEDDPEAPITTYDLDWTQLAPEVQMELVGYQWQAQPSLPLIPQLAKIIGGHVPVAVPLLAPIINFLGSGEGVEAISHESSVECVAALVDSAVTVDRFLKGSHVNGFKLAISTAETPAIPEGKNAIAPANTVGTDVIAPNSSEESKKLGVARELLATTRNELAQANHDKLALQRQLEEVQGQLASVQQEKQALVSQLQEWSTPRSTQQETQDTLTSDRYTPAIVGEDTPTKLAKFMQENAQDKVEPSSFTAGPSASRHIGPSGSFAPASTAQADKGKAKGKAKGKEKEYHGPARNTRSHGAI